MDTNTQQNAQKDPQNTNFNYQGINQNNFYYFFTPEQLQMMHMNQLNQINQYKFLNSKTPDNQKPMSKQFEQASQFMQDSINRTEQIPQHNIMLESKMQHTPMVPSEQMPQHSRAQHMLESQILSFDVQKEYVYPKIPQQLVSQMMHNQNNSRQLYPNVPLFTYHNQWDHSQQTNQMPIIKLEQPIQLFDNQPLFNPQFVPCEPIQFNMQHDLTNQQERIQNIERQIHFNNANYQVLLENYLMIKLENDNLKLKQKKQRTKRIKKEKICYDNSKNILREYQRAIYKYILNNQQLCEKILGFPLEYIVNQRRQIMGNIQSIKDLRSLWIKPRNASKEDESVNKMIRIISYKFLREEAIAFFSKKKNKIENILDYKSLLMKFLREPANFIALKIPKKQ